MPNNEPADLENIMPVMARKVIEDTVPASNLASMPQMNIDIAKEPNEKEPIITDKVLLDVYKDIVTDINTGTKQINEVLDNFLNMLSNEGDGTSTTKEAIVNLIKIKNEQADKKTKVADLMTRLKLKEKDTFPKYLAAHQTNNINMGTDKKSLIEDMERMRLERGNNEK